MKIIFNNMYYKAKQIIVYLLFLGLLSTGCIQSFRKDHNGLSIHSSVSFLPPNCEKRFLSIVNHYTRIIQIQELQYSQKDYGHLIGFEGSYEVKKDVDLHESVRHQTYFFILDKDEVDWNKAKLYQVQNYIDVLSPSFSEIFDLSKDELMLWLIEVPIVIPDGKTHLEWSNKEFYPNYILKKMSGNEQHNINHNLHLLEQHNKSYFDVETIARQIILQVGDQFRPSPDALFWWNMLPEPITKPLFDYLEGVWNITGIAMGVDNYTNRYIDLFFDSNHFTLWITLYLVGDPPSKKSFPGFHEIKLFEHLKMDI